MAAKRNNRSRWVLAASVSVALLLAGCGAADGDGGDQGGSVTAPPPPAQTTLSGNAVKGPVAGATVTAFAVSNGVVGAQIASATTNTQGAFTMPMGTHAGPIVLRMTGGSYTDEATGTPMPMAAGDVMTAVMTSASAGSTTGSVQITPLTTMAHAMAATMSGGLTDANIATANAAVGRHFLVDDILHTVPMNPLVAGSGAGATTSMIHYGITLAAMSQYAKSIGMRESSTMVSHMASDASDGVMNGMMVGTRISMMSGGGMGGGRMMDSSAGTSGLAAAMSEFMNSNWNRSDLTAAHVSSLMLRLHDSDGRIR